LKIGARDLISNATRPHLPSLVGQSDRAVKIKSSHGGHLEFSIGIKKQKLCRGPSNDHSWAVWFQSSKWFQRRSVLKHFSQQEKNIFVIFYDLFLKITARSD
jgi:hypothetical protein